MYLDSSLTWSPYENSKLRCSRLDQWQQLLTESIIHCRDDWHRSSCAPACLTGPANGIAAHWYTMINHWYPLIKSWQFIIQSKYPGFFSAGIKSAKSTTIDRKFNNTLQGVYFIAPGVDTKWIGIGNCWNAAPIGFYFDLLVRRSVWLKERRISRSNRLATWKASFEHEPQTA